MSDKPDAIQTAALVSDPKCPHCGERLLIQVIAQIIDRNAAGP